MNRTRRQPLRAIAIGAIVAGALLVPSAVLMIAIPAYGNPAITRPQRWVLLGVAALIILYGVGVRRGWTRTAAAAAALLAVGPFLFSKGAHAGAFVWAAVWILALCATIRDAESAAVAPREPR